MSFAKELQDLRNNNITLKDHIHETCERIESLDSTINSFLPEPGRYKRLIKEAEELEKRYPRSVSRPPLYGALVGIKDTLHVDGFSTNAGSLLPASLFKGSEAETVTRLRDAGALILGKTVTTEFAAFEPGPTLNPHNTDYTPGGSSSGSAAAVAANLSSLTIGTQTIGSVNRPASFCGIVGFKPSLGRIPIDGIIHYSKSMDQVGFFTKNMIGVDIVASILCNSWLPNEEKNTPILGVPEGPYLTQVPTESMDLFEMQIEKLVGAGFLIKRIPVLKNIKEINRLHTGLVMAELAEEHDEWFERYEPLYRNMTKKVIQKGKKISPQTLENAKQSTLILRKYFQVIMDYNKIDMWISPSALGHAPKGLQSTGDPVMNVPWTHAGMPILTLPAGQASNGLPIGLQCVGSYMKDEQVVNWSKMMEKVLLA